MSDAAMLFGYIGPMMVVAGAAWRMSARLTQVQVELQIIKAENARLASDIRSLQALLSLLVDSRRPAG
jgi:ApbE superfamily uncharacterized protein (UPF0280 family)